ncbi:MAG: hypothetical protein AAFO99_13900 [Bacteroidota bacterium]
MNLARWKQLMEDFGFSENRDTYHLLMEYYSEKHRAYHNIEHIEDCLTQLDAIVEEIPWRKEIELALWFHDAIYNPYGKDNELKSAQLAMEFLKQQNGNAQLESILFNLIMATLHKEEPTNLAEKIMMDIDISILGTDYPTYRDYAKKIRREYRLVPGILYRKKRKEILCNFLERQPLYYSKYFKRLETRARENLRREI